MGYLIPDSLGELYDLLVYMALSAPSMTSEHFPDQNVDSVFGDLQDGLESLKRKLGDTGLRRLTEAADQAKAYCKTGDLERSAHILQHMAEYVRLGKYRTDEDVVDEDRFEHG